MATVVLVGLFIATVLLGRSNDVIYRLTRVVIYYHVWLHTGTHDTCTCMLVAWRVQ